jgi:hypothetical protein
MEANRVFLSGFDHEPQGRDAFAHCDEGVAGSALNL